MTVAPALRRCTALPSDECRACRAAPENLCQTSGALLYELFAVRHSPRPRIRLDRSASHEFADAARPASLPACPYAVYLAGFDGRYRLLCFDLDAAQSGAVVLADLDRLRALLDPLGIGYVVAASGPTGGRHVWLRLTEAVDAAVVRRLAYALAAVLPSLDIGTLTNPATGCARPPGAVHRAGGRSELLEPATPAQAAVELGRGVAPELLQLVFDALPPTARQAGESAGARAAAVHPLVIDDDLGPRLVGERRALSPSTAALLRADPAGRDASALLWRVLLRAAMARWRFADVLQLVDDAAWSGLEHARSVRAGAVRVPRSRAERNRLLERQWRRAVEHAAGRVSARRSGPVEDVGRAVEVAAAVAAVDAAADAMPWRWATPGGPGDRAALKALCLVALAGCSLEVALDCRRWAQLTGHGKSTMAAAAIRLSCTSPLDGPAWITLATPAEGTKAAVWRLLSADVPSSVAVSPSVDTARTQGLQPAPGVRDYVRQPPASSRRGLTERLTADLQRLAHDLWTPRGGLGHHIERTFSQLQKLPRKVTDLAQVTGYEPATIRRHLQTLHQHKLAVRQRGGWRLARRGSLDSVATRLEVAGTGTLRQQRHRVDRELHGWWLDEQHWRRHRGKSAGTGARAVDEAQQAIPIPTGPRRTYGRFPTAAGGRADYTRAAAIVSRRLGCAELAAEATRRVADRLLRDRAGATGVGIAA